MCHTLVSNVTVDFTKYYGNALAFRWKREFIGSLPFWKIYVHDRNEHVLLTSYAMETQPTLTMTKPKMDENGKFLDNSYQQKATITPKLLIRPKPSPNLPCSNEDLYSRNLCHIQHGWKEKFKAIQDIYRENFTCQLPGIKVQHEIQKQTCQNYHRESNGSLGFEDLSGAGRRSRYGMKYIFQMFT